MKMKKTIRMPLRRPPTRTRPAKPKPSPKSMRARAATADEAYDDDYDDEPNMKFSHALLVVLVLHLVAVGGVLTFSWMKERQITKVEPSAVADSSFSQKPGTAEAGIPGWQGRTYAVAAGDTLTRIASLHGTTVEAIQTENNLTAHSIIRVGQLLKIPAAAKSAIAKKPEPAAQKDEARPSAAAKQAFIATKTKTDATPIRASVISAEPKSKPHDAKPASSDIEVYVVVKGDNPYSIAKRMGVNYNTLIEINDIKDPTKIQIGQKLKIPATKN